MAGTAEDRGASLGVLFAASALAAPPIAWGAVLLGLGMATRDPARDIALLVLWSIAEEIVFRGGLQPAVARALVARGLRDQLSRHLSTSNLLVSTVFAMAHLWGHPPLAALAVWPVSLVYGLAREASGRVWPPAVLHVAFNLLLYGASWLSAGGR